MRRERSVSGVSYIIRSRGRFFSSAFVFDASKGVIPSWMTFSRASAGTYYNKLGVLVTVSADVARFDNDSYTLDARGILIEDVRENLDINSDMITGYVDGGAAHTFNYGGAPDGTNTSVLVAETAVTSTHGFNPNTSNVSYVAGNKYTRSYHIKPNTARYVQIVFNSGPFGSVFCNFDLVDCVVGTSSGLTGAIERLANGWLRISATGTCLTSASGSAGLLYFAQSASSSRLPSYLGSGHTFEVWGNQVEVGPRATSFIATSGTTVTRAQDVASFEIPSNVSQLEYTFDDNSTQTVFVSSGSYTIPYDLNRNHIKKIVGSL